MSNPNGRPKMGPNLWTAAWSSDGCLDDKWGLHFPVCTECPLPKCKYDYPADHVFSIGHYRAAHRDRHIAHFDTLGLTVEQVAALMGRDVRTVFRSLARSKERAAS